MIRKDVIITVLTTFCLTATLFTVIPIRSSLPYDPWADLRGPYEDPDIPDGTINMRDIGYIANMFMASGDPTKNVNVTNWPSWLPSGNVNANVTNWPTENNANVTNWPSQMNVNVTNWSDCTPGGSQLAGNDTVTITLLDRQSPPIDVYRDTVFANFTIPFVPKQNSWNITHMQVDFIVYTSDVANKLYKFDVMFNNGPTIGTGQFAIIGSGIEALTLTIEDPQIYQTIHSGINKLTIRNVQGLGGNWFLWQMQLYHVTLSIEYEYAP